MDAPRVYADFQNLDDENRLRLTCAGTVRDLQKLRIELVEGLSLTFYTDDADEEGNPDEMRLDGIVHFDQTAECWVAAVDWANLRHESDEEALPLKASVPRSA